MDYGRDSGNGIHIIGGEGPREGADNRGDLSLLATGHGRTAIISGPGSSAGFGDGGGPTTAPPLAPETSNRTLKRLSCKTRICNKWEQTAYCPYGSKCTFAHGATELQRYGGGLLYPEATPLNVVAASGPSLARAGGSELLPGTTQRSLETWNKVNRFWKGRKINGIYGDWIDDNE